MKMLTADALAAAERYMLLNARLIDRLRYERLVGGGSPDRVLAVLRAYQNADGGFGNALEPDLRGPGSQPEPVEVAFWILDEMDAFDDPMVLRACDYLMTITTADGGVPFVTPSVRETPRAPWWETPDDPPGHLIPTASIAGLLHKHKINHPWLGPATEFTWAEIEKTTEFETYTARAIVNFLERVSDRDRAHEQFARLREAILATVALDPDAQGEAHFPLDFAPEPGELPLFSDEILQRHLDALIDQQTSEGGWEPNFPMWTPVVRHEWGGFLTVERLKTLKAYGRLV
ncbi:hypothetical protein ACFFMN_10180 [Planobispora siamensis]|uniref:Prenyltransferase and squalene oxidase repeat-containing protein n=1 Tax=Planobispora siamensis TaxID=936338 RepID=A0A8J3SA83_9ACTN|nr:hypothetical protein [Planobispora siamensis]GIH90293.1 hypothetical protein Psi01_09230 [Planobispora siamensis]